MTIESIAPIAFILLIIRFVSVFFIVMVISQQWRLLRKKTESELAGLKMVMFLLGHALLVGSVLPIVADFYYAFLHDGGAETSIIVWYAISNCLTHFTGAVLLWNIYRIASSLEMELDEIHESEQKEVPDGSRTKR